MKILRAICIVLAFFSFRQIAEASITYYEEENLNSRRSISDAQNPDNSVKKLSFIFREKEFSENDMRLARDLVERNKDTLRDVEIIGTRDYNLTSIFDVLRPATNLTSFSIKFKMLDGQESYPYPYQTTWKTFCRGLQDLTNLRDVNISWYLTASFNAQQKERPSGITGAMSVRLAKSLQGKPITSLRFGKLTLGDEALEGLAPALETMSSLRTLNLEADNITNQGTHILAGVLRGLNQLEHLYLNRSLFGLSGVETIVRALNHPMLRDVSFCGRGLSEADKTNEGRTLTQLFVDLVSRSNMLRVISIGGVWECSSFSQEFPIAMVGKGYWATPCEDTRTLFFFIPQQELRDLARGKNIVYDPSNTLQDIQDIVGWQHLHDSSDYRGFKTLPQYLIYDLVRSRLIELGYIRDVPFV